MSDDSQYPFTHTHTPQRSLLALHSVIGACVRSIDDHDGFEVYTVIILCICVRERYSDRPTASKKECLTISFVIMHVQYFV